jgi:sugar lactone lactonase YvrE
VKQHVLSDFLNCMSPVWIGDETLLFAGLRGEGLEEVPEYIWRFDLRTGKLRHLTDRSLGTNNYLTLSADEKTIVFTATTRSTEWRLWEISVDGTGLRQLTRGKTSPAHLSPV